MLAVSAILTVKELSLGTGRIYNTALSSVQVALRAFANIFGEALNVGWIALGAITLLIVAVEAVCWARLAGFTVVVMLRFA